MQFFLYQLNIFTRVDSELTRTTLLNSQSF